MTDYYTHFTVQLEIKRKEHLKFWLTASADLSESEAPKGKKERAAFAKKYGDKLLEDWTDNGSLGLELEVAECCHTPRVHIQDIDGHGNLEQAGLLIQAFLRKFDIAAPAAFTYAETCDKHRVEGFGGGWVRVTREEVVVDDALSQMDAWLKGVTPVNLTRKD
jgi:hypothetical protein